MDRILVAAIAVVVVPAFMVGYILAVEAAVRSLPRRIGARLRPWLWLFPALAFLFMFLVYPTIATIFRSFYDTAGTTFIGLDNYARFFRQPDTLAALRNNVLWMVLLTGICVGLGLLIAVLVDRVRYEPFAKAVIFLPMAISFVAAAIIWRLVY